MLVEAYIIDSTGSHKKLIKKTVRLRELKANQVRIKHTAIAVNKIDADVRKGILQVEMPNILGFAAVGIIEEINSDTTRYKIGERVGYLLEEMGAYSEARNLDIDDLLVIPEGISDKDAAVLILNGLMAYYLVSRIFIIQPKMRVLINGAAGNLGMLITSLAKFAGAIVIGTVGSEASKEIAINNGCNYVVNYNLSDFEQKMSEICQSNKINVVYDFVGRDVFNRVVKYMADYSLMVNAGWASGIVKEFNIEALRAKNIFVVSPNVFKYAKEFEFKLAMSEIFELFSKKILLSNITQEYSFNEIPIAHQNLENRDNYGSSVILL